MAETGGRRVTRHWLHGPQAGRTETLVSDLPGYPDNIALGSDGLVWVTVASPTDPVLEPSRFHMVTGVREHAGQVWLGSLVEPAVAVFDLAGSGSGHPGPPGPGQ